MKGEISKSMGVDTKPAHKIEVDGFWILIDPKMPEKQLEDIKRLVKQDTFDKYHWREKYYQLKKTLDNKI